MKEIIHIKSITEINKTFGLSAPKHPLITIMWAKDFPDFSQYYGVKYNSDLFSISLKDGIEGVLGYGRNNYDFEDGTMISYVVSLSFMELEPVYNSDYDEFGEDEIGF